MDAERWRQIDELFRAVSQAEPGRRAALLAELAAGDGELRREVEALLKAFESAGGFLESNVFEAAAPLLAGESHELQPGQLFGRYRVVERIGAGGMGEVYSAKDTRLRRRVALKLLPAFLTSDAERVRRFELEARAVASLSHPNVCVIHEVVEAEGGLRCIVMELVEGRTLRELIEGGGLGIGQALEIAVQSASALAAAHEAGVIHRDVKPENVMVRADGYVKVLDFGLAKLTERAEAGGETAETLLMPSTQTGLVMGTTHYMSPEQARGQKADARTDVWSLGVVLYEMVAGVPPFEGETAGDVLVSILKDKPAPLSEHAPDVPEELERAVGRALRKEPGERYQAMGEMLAELREVRDEVTFRARQERHLSDGVERAHAGRAAPVAAARGRAGRRRSRTAAWAALLAVAASALAFGVYEYVKSRRTPPPPPTAKMTRLTANGKIRGVAITRDGKHVAYTAGPRRQQGLWVMQVGTGSTVQIVPPADEVQYWGLTFSPDGDYVYFVKTLGGGPWELYRVPTLGGTPKRLLVNIDTAVEFSPDGGRMAFGRVLNLGESQLVLANADGTGERVVATRKSPFIAFEGVVKIAWSPDGESLAFPSGNAAFPGDNKYEVVALSLKDGTERPLTREKWHFVKQVAWLGDGSGLVMVARDRPSATNQVWHLSSPDGSVRRISNDFSDYETVSVTADSATIATVQSERLSNVWVAPDADASRARQITDSRDDGARGLSWTPDGRVVFTSRVGVNTNIWIMDADGSNRRKLTDYAGWDMWPSVSADGRYVVFESRRGDGRNIWRTDIDGGNPVRLADGNLAAYPHCSPDGRWVFYAAAALGKSYQSLWKVPIDGGDPVRVSDKWAIRPWVSPDQKWLAYWYGEPEINPPYGAAIAPSEGGPPVKRFEINWESEVLRWTPDSRALAYLDQRSMNVWAQPIDGGPPRQLTDFKSDQTFYFDWSRDGKQLALARGTQTSDVVMITDFK